MLEGIPSGLFLLLLSWVSAVKGIAKKSTRWFYFKDYGFLLPWFCSRWIIHAMEYELQIRSGDKPAKDLYQLSPSEVKQLLLDILQPQQNGR